MQTPALPKWQGIRSRAQQKRPALPDSPTLVEICAALRSDSGCVAVKELHSVVVFLKSERPAARESKADPEGYAMHRFDYPDGRAADRVPRTDVLISVVELIRSGGVAGWNVVLYPPKRTPASKKTWWQRPSLSRSQSAFTSSARMPRCQYSCESTRSHRKPKTSGIGFWITNIRVRVAWLRVTHAQATCSSSVLRVPSPSRSG
jgi:hypothetical protein